MPGENSNLSAILDPDEDTDAQSEAAAQT